MVAAWEPVVFHNNFHEDRTPWQGPPTDEVDQNWDKLYKSEFHTVPNTAAGSRSEMLEYTECRQGHYKDSQGGCGPASEPDHAYPRRRRQLYCWDRSLPSTSLPGEFILTCTYVPGNHRCVTNCRFVGLPTAINQWRAGYHTKGAVPRQIRRRYWYESRPKSLLLDSSRWVNPNFFRLVIPATSTRRV